MEGEDDWPLFFPCKCSGSIKYVHQDCLQTWMKHSKITSCELCKHPFDFTPIYSPDTPTMLPPHELLRGLLGRMRGSMRFLGRLVVVICVWLAGRRRCHATATVVCCRCFLAFTVLDLR